MLLTPSDELEGGHRCRGRTWSWLREELVRIVGYHGKGGDVSCCPLVWNGRRRFTEVWGYLQACAGAWRKRGISGDPPGR